jgi:hypothetical protein
MTRADFTPGALSPERMFPNAAAGLEEILLGFVVGLQEDVAVRTLVHMEPAFVCAENEGLAAHFFVESIGQLKPMQDVGERQPGVSPEPTEFLDLDEGRVRDSYMVMSVERLQCLSDGVLRERVGPCKRKLALDKRIDALGFKIKITRGGDCRLRCPDCIEGLEDLVARYRLFA